MSFRLRVALLAGAAVAIAVVAASGVVYVVVRHQLLGDVDRSLVNRAREFVQGPAPGREFGIVPLGPRANLGGPPTVLQAIGANGEGAVIRLPGLDRAQQIAAEGGRPFFSEGHVGDVHVRVYSAQVGNGIAVQVARPLDEVDHTLHRLGLYLLFIGVAGIGIASALGLLVAQATLRPVGQLTSVAEEVTETRDLSRRITTGSRDELGRLASAFNAMLEALDASLRSQRQLVADASHELRTPLASLRTNIEVLASGKQLPPEERTKLLRDVIGQVEELSALVAALVELDPDALPELEDVRLDEVVAAAVQRARMHTPNVEFREHLAESVVRASPVQVDRAVSNLLDNAAKWSDSVDVSVNGHTVTVRDHGPGIAPEDLPYVFDRFYRAAAARKLPGSGLGLAIVKQVASSHGGNVTAENAPDGGAVFRLRLGDHDGAVPSPR
ncbi:MAG TPA: HAMP domain-containing sensor histidine kinase [Gaiellaceae bacterium]|nr:HAMP domain-containing sensor histidine kinase [Gaiellaceae bacterium]